MSPGQRLYETIRFYSPDKPEWSALPEAEQTRFEALLDDLAATSVARGIWKVLKILDRYDLEGIHVIEMEQEYLSDDGHVKVAERVCGPFPLLRIKPGATRETAIVVGPGTPDPGIPFTR